MGKKFIHKDGTPLSGDELLRKINRNDRIFRVLQSLFMISVALTLTGVVGAQYRTLRAFQVQSEERRVGLEKIQLATQNSVDEEKRYIHCIAEFFAAPDRASKVITDLDNCAVVKLDTGPADATYDGEPAPSSPYRTATQTPWPDPTPAITTTPRPSLSPVVTPAPTCRLRLLGVCFL